MAEQLLRHGAYEYAKKVFGMFSGSEASVKLRFDVSLVGSVIDRLGRDTIIIPDGENCFVVWTDVIISPRFYAWVFGFGDKARILEPAAAVEGIKEHIKNVLSVYE